MKSHLASQMQEQDHFRVVTPEERTLHYAYINYSFQKVRVVLKAATMDLVEAARRHLMSRSAENAGSSQRNSWVNLYAYVDVYTGIYICLFV